MLDYATTLRNALVLSTLPEAELNTLASLVRSQKLAAGETYAVRGQPIAGMVLVESGNVEVLLESSPVATLSTGSLFAEDALTANAPAPASLRAAVASQIGVLARSAIEEKMPQLPAVRRALDTAWRHRVLAARLYTIDLFRNLSGAARAKLADAFEVIDFHSGEPIATVGEVGDAFYVIRAGEARLHLPEGNDPQEVTLGMLDYVGDACVLEDVTHSATVTVPDLARCMRLDRAGFEAALADLPEALAAVKAARARRDEAMF